MQKSQRREFLAKCASATLLAGTSLRADDKSDSEKGKVMKLNLRSVSAKEGVIRFQTKVTEWEAKKTAIIVCDMWDDHWCKSAARRVVEMAPALNRTVNTARSQGAFIIHAPSSTVDHYKDTPQRKHAQNAPFVKAPVTLATSKRWGTAWCWPDKNQETVMPIDDSDMGCDCVKKCEIRSAWSKQIDLVEIHKQDAITDNSQETYNLLQQHGIEHVVLCGVHLNMCVLGRPFGIRQMVYLGNKDVALMRDMTDTMYNSAMKPYVDHFTGTDLVIQHVERYWCPSFVSTDITSKPAFKFKEDQR